MSSLWNYMFRQNTPTPIVTNSPAKPPLASPKTPKAWVVSPVKGPKYVPTNEKLTFNQYATLMKHKELMKPGFGRFHDPMPKSPIKKPDAWAGLSVADKKRNAQKRWYKVQKTLRKKK